MSVVVISGHYYFLELHGLHISLQRSFVEQLLHAFPINRVQKIEVG